MKQLQKLQDPSCSRWAHFGWLKNLTSAWPNGTSGRVGKMAKFRTWPYGPPYGPYEAFDRMDRMVFQASQLQSRYKSGSRQGLETGVHQQKVAALLQLRGSRKLPSCVCQRKLRGQDTSSRIISRYAVRTAGRYDNKTWIKTEYGNYLLFWYQNGRPVWRDVILQCHEQGAPLYCCGAAGGAGNAAAEGEQLSASVASACICMMPWPWPGKMRIWVDTRKELI